VDIKWLDRMSLQIRRPLSLLWIWRQIVLVEKMVVVAWGRKLDEKFGASILVEHK
jgi:hypothetical protein